MHRRAFLAATALTAAPSTPARAVDDDPGPAVREVIRRYVAAREARAPKDIEPLLTPDADQLVSDGTWRRGREALVRGMLESSAKNPARRTIEVESVRRLAPDIVLADGRYLQKAGPDGGEDRVMWASITLKKDNDGWRIAAIRNMKPTPGG